MNYKIAAAVLTLAAAFGSAGCSHHGNNQQEGPVSNASTQLPQTPPYTATSAPRAGTTAAGAGSAAMAGSAGMAATAAGAASAGAPPKSFDDLAGSKGYVTRQDAQHDSWLDSHFARCDTNHDGKLSQQEYTQCMQMRGSGLPPESASSVHG